jgi:polysaccharide biosynthesis PFTS motif protein
VGLFTGRWWHALLLNEAASAAAFRFQPQGQEAREYLFHQSSWLYRPMWTYEAERRGARVSLYFYATNTEAFKQNGSYPPIFYGYSAMNWPHYLVWDEYQADFVRRAAGPDAQVSVVGPIWFHGSRHELPPLPPQTVAVFDIQPVRDSYYQSLGQELEYYLPTTSERFLRDIIEVASDLGFFVAFKRKRELSITTHPRYRRFVETYQHFERVIVVAPDTSANRVIEQSAAVISMPFTSTAVLGGQLGKPSAYYDATRLIAKDDRAAHGVEVLIGRDELRNWLASKVLGLSPQIETSV